MKIFAIRDESAQEQKDLAYLLYYEQEKRFYIAVSYTHLYAHTREECEEKLKALIAEMNKERKNLKEQLARCV